MVGPWEDGNAFLFKDDSDRLRMLCTYGAQTQRQVATHLGLSTGAAISIQPSGTFAGCGKMPLTSILSLKGRTLNAQKKTPPELFQWGQVLVRR